MHRFHALCAAGPLIAAGCASLDARPDVARAAEAVEAAVGADAAALLVDETAAAEQTAALLAEGLSADEAAQVALLNNPRVRAALAALGVSRADFVQSTLFSNPTLALSLRFPDGGGLANFEVALAQNLAELWLIPVRREAAQRDLERAVAEAARTVAETVLDARVAYVRAVRAAGQAQIARDTRDLSARLVEVARLRQDAGTGSELDITLARSKMLDAQTAARSAELSAVEERSALARLLGLAIPPDALRLTDALGAPPPVALTADNLQAAARHYRLDLRIADESVAASEARVRAERARFVRSLELGVSLERGERRPRGNPNYLAETLYESVDAGQLSIPRITPRESEGSDVVIGPTIGVELPLWDQNQAQIARAEHLLDAARRLRDALLVDAAQDAHAGLARARAAAQNAQFYRDQQLPTAERSASLSREAYRVGRTPLLAVLEAERSLLTARSGYLESLERAALARIELERVTGRPLAGLGADAGPAAAAAESAGGR